MQSTQLLRKIGHFPCVFLSRISLHIHATILLHFLNISAKKKKKEEKKKKITRSSMKNRVTEGVKLRKDIAGGKKKKMKNVTWKAPENYEKGRYMKKGKTGGKATWRNKWKRIEKKKEEKKLMKFKTLNRKRRCVVYKNDKRSVSALKVKVVKREGDIESWKKKKNRKTLVKLICGVVVKKWERGRSKRRIRKVVYKVVYEEEKWKKKFESWKKKVKTSVDYC